MPRALLFPFFPYPSLMASVKAAQTSIPCTLPAALCLSPARAPPNSTKTHPPVLPFAAACLARAFVTAHAAAAASSRGVRGLAGCAGTSDGAGPPSPWPSCKGQQVCEMFSSCELNLRAFTVAHGCIAASTPKQQHKGATAYSRSSALRPKLHPVHRMPYVGHHVPPHSASVILHTSACTVPLHDHD